MRKGSESALSKREDEMDKWGFSVRLDSKNHVSLEFDGQLLPSDADMARAMLDAWHTKVEELICQNTVATTPPAVEPQ